MLKLCKVCGEYKEESEFPVHWDVVYVENLTQLV